MLTTYRPRLSHSAHHIEPTLITYRPRLSHIPTLIIYAHAYHICPTLIIYDFFIFRNYAYHVYVTLITLTIRVHAYYKSFHAYNKSFRTSRACVRAFTSF